MNKIHWLWIVGGVLVVALILFITGNPTTPPLQLPARKPAKTSKAVVKANAFDDFARASDLLATPPRDAEFDELLTTVWTGPWRDDDRLAKHLANNEPALRALDLGLTRARCALPRYENPESPLTYLIPFRELARLKAIRAKKLVASGKAGAAGTEATQILKFGDMILRGGGPLVTYRLGIAIKHIGYDVVLHVLASPALNVTELEQFAAELAPFHGDSDALANALAVEHRAVGLWLLGIASEQNFVAVVAAVSGGQPSSIVHRLLEAPPTYRLEETGNLMEQFFAMADFNARHPWPERKNLREALDKVLAEPFDLRREPNARGLIVLHLVFDQIPPTLEHQRRIEAEASAVAAMIALAIHKLQHGELPDSLPGNFGDPFSAWMLHYSKDRALVWSVGPDGTNDEAHAVYEPSRPQGDLIFPIPFPR